MPQELHSRQLDMATCSSRRIWPGSHSEVNDREHEGGAHPVLTEGLGERQKVGQRTGKRTEREVKGPLRINNGQLTRGGLDKEDTQGSLAWGT